ncbi:MAG: tRNA (adenine-N1)-methyltransferase, partial [Anaerolineales bacterium]
FETLLRTWNIQGRSVRPDHRMVAHSGFITVARKVEPGLWGRGLPSEIARDQDEGHDVPPEPEDQAE